MTFKELQKVFLKNFGSDRPADIAKEFGVSSQVVGNWKQRDQVPYKYAMMLREKNKSFGQGEVNFQEVVKNILSGKTIEKSNQNKNVDETVIDILVNYFYMFYNKKNIIFIWLFVCFFCGFLFLINATPTFIASTKILPLSSNSGSSVSGIAAQFGIDVKAGGNKDLDLSSSEMIPDLLKSRKLAKEILSASFMTEKYGYARPLSHILSGTENDSLKISAHDYEGAIQYILSSIKVMRPVRTSGLLIISVYTFEPKLAMDIVNEIIIRLKELTNGFRLNRLEQKASFIRNRLNTVKNDLVKSEDKLTKFRQKNRNIEFSPALMLKQERLVRDVEVQKEIYITLKNQYELIQIETVGMDDYIQVLDEPEMPLSRTRPSIKSTVILVIFLGFVTGILHIIIIFYYARLKRLFYSKQNV